MRSPRKSMYMHKKHDCFFLLSQTIDYSSPRGGISVETNTSGNIPTSYLLIDSVAPSDSGKYTCHPANAQEVGVNVHIQDGMYLHVLSAILNLSTSCLFSQKALGRHVYKKPRMSKHCSCADLCGGRGTVVHTLPIYRKRRRQLEANHC